MARKGLLTHHRLQLETSMGLSASRRYTLLQCVAERWLLNGRSIFWVVDLVVKRLYFVR